jgi:hypothetical protein
MSGTSWVAHFVAAGSLIFVSSTGFAEGRSGAEWTDAHMLSNYANAGRAPRPALRGLDANGRIAHEAAPSRSTVEALELTINPHGWQPGAGRGGRSHATRQSSGFSATNAWPSRTLGTNRASSVGAGRRSAR